MKKPKKVDSKPTYQDLVNELHLQIGHIANRKRVFVLVEGDSDVRLFRKFFLEAVEIIAMVGGNEKLKDALRLFSPKHKYLLGIKDADFDRLMQREAMPNLFLTDFHDLEMMLAFSSETFASIMHEFGNHQKTEFDNLRTKLLDSISFLGHLRWLNEEWEEDNRLKFSGLNISKYLEISTYSLDKTKLMQDLIQRSPNTLLKEVEVIEKEVSTLMDKHQEKWEVNNGHDFMKVIAWYLTNTTAKENSPSDKSVESAFRMSYQLQHFEQTQLYQKLQEWATKNKCKLLEINSL